MDVGVPIRAEGTKGLNRRHRAGSDVFTIEKFLETLVDGFEGCLGEKAEHRCQDLFSELFGKQPRALGLTGWVKIVDFGLARSGDDGGGCVGGTLNYIALEQACGEPTDARTDIYSLGATLYELLTGHAPFTTGDLVKHHLESPVPPIANERSGLPAYFEALVMQCLSKDPAERYESARAVLASFSQKIS